MPHPEIFLSFFMFTADLRPEDASSAAAIARHMGALRDMGYDGFDLPIAPRPTADHAAEVDAYRRLRDGLDA